MPRGMLLVEVSDDSKRQRRCQVLCHWQKMVAQRAAWLARLIRRAEFSVQLGFRGLSAGRNSQLGFSCALYSDSCILT